MARIDQSVIVENLCAPALEVFATMLGLELEPGIPYSERNPGGSDDGITSLIGLAGSWTGAGGIRCSAAAGCRMASAFLMAEYAEVNGEVLDAVAELTNMIVGNFKVLIEPQTGPLGLSIPSVIHGQSYLLHNAGAEEWTVIPFAFESHRFDLRLFLAPARAAVRRS